MFLLFKNFGSVGWRKMGLLAASAVLAASQSSCKTTSSSTHMLVSVKDQRMILLDRGKPKKAYPISTSKYGLGDKPGSYRTPTGRMRVFKKIGGGHRQGTVFKSRRPTGEVVKPNSPGRDPIVTRILWLEGLQKKNRNAKRRYIYIHGTPEERTIGRPSSYGCIRMKSRDIVDLYKRVAPGSDVYVTTRGLRLAEVPPSEKALYAAVKERERPTPQPLGMPVESAEVLAAATPSSTMPPSEVRARVPTPARSPRNEDEDWQLSRDEARALLRKKL